MIATSDAARRIAGVKAVAAQPEHPIAERIRAYSRERGISLAELSRRAGLSRSTASKVCERLDTEAGDVGVATMTALAKAMGQPLTWLLYGETPPPAVRLRDLEGWPEAVAEAVGRLGVDSAAAAAIGTWAVHEQPPRVDALFVAALARAFRGGA